MIGRFFFLEAGIGTLDLRRELNGGHNAPMRARLFLWISLSLNIFLIVALVSDRQRQARQADSDGPPTSPPSAVAPEIPAEPPARASAAVEGAEFSSWKALHSDDFKAFVEKLREAGFPEESVRDIVVGEVGRSHRLKKLGSIVVPDLEWWKPEADEEFENLIEAQTGALREEREELLAQLLGENWDRGRGSDADIKPLYGPELIGLSVSAARSVREIEAQFAERLRVYQQAREVNGEPVVEAELARMQEARRLALEELLDDAQMQAYLVRFSDRARRLRRELTHFNATSNEFVTIFQIRDPIEREIQLKHGGGDTESLQARKDLERKADAEIKAALGAERFQAYRYNLDPLYRNAMSFVETYGGAPNAALHLFEISHMGKAERERIENDLTKDEVARRAELERARSQLEENLKKVLGPEAYRKYRESGANFLDSLPR